MTTLDPLVGRCLLVGFAGTTLPDWVARWLDEGLAGAVLFGRNVADPAQVAALVRDIRARRDDALVAIDEEGGQVTRLHERDGSRWPGNAALGHLDDVATTEAVAAGLADELAALGINVNLAPVADVNVEAANPVIGVRAFGADPALVARHVAAFVRGTQARGVAACAKHFPGHGDTVLDSHADLPTVHHDLDRLHAVDLPPFRAAVEAGVHAVMTAHIRFPALDDDPATVSRRILTGLLRDELGFEGVVLTDALEMRAMADTLGVGEAAVAALSAGADLLCTGLEEEPGRVAATALAEALREGRLPAERLERAAGRVARLAAAVPATPAAGSPAGDGGPAGDLAGRVARRALVRRHADRLPIGRPLHVIELEPTFGPGVGGRMVSVHAAARAGRPDTTGGIYDERAWPRALPAPEGRAVVVVCRDLARERWQQQVLDRLVAERGDDLTVVLTGLADDIALLPAALPVLACHGASRGGVQAVVHALLEPAP